MSFACGFPGCGKVYTRADNLKRHELVHTGERYQCPVEGCGQGFTTSHKLKAHVARHQRPFPCTHPGCPEAFPTDDKRRAHEAAQHGGALPHACEECGRAFRYLSELRTHARTHAAPSPVTHYCIMGECLRRFPSKEALAAHVQAEHPRPHTCPECGEGFTTSSNLSAHRKTHLASRTLFKCPVEGCGRDFTRRGNLNKHVQAAHLGEKPFVCSYGCGMRSAYKSKVEEHEAVLHRGMPRPPTHRARPPTASLKEQLGKRLRSQVN